MASNVTIRPLREDECELLQELVTDHAEYIQERHLIITTTDTFRRGIFGKPKQCSCLVAEIVTHEGTNRLAGYVLYYVAFSSFRGPFIHLGDIHVLAQYRRMSIGTMLYQAVAQNALDMGCPYVELSVLGTNTRAREFYAKIGMIDQTEIDGRHRMLMYPEAMERLVGADRQGSA